MWRVASRAQAAAASAALAARRAKSEPRRLETDHEHMESGRSKIGKPCFRGVTFCATFQGRAKRGSCFFDKLPNDSPREQGNKRWAGPFMKWIRETNSMPNVCKYGILASPNTTCQRIWTSPHTVVGGLLK